MVVSDPVYSQPDLTPTQLRASRSVLRKYVKGEERKRETEKSKNTLESYIVDCRNWMADNPEVQDVSASHK